MAPERVGDYRKGRLEEIEGIRRALWKREWCTIERTEWKK
jgi:hypothetical protein